MSPAAGDRLDAYELLQLLGSGGMGEVWLAREARLGRKVALKLLPAELTSDPSRVSRFNQEARAASALNHPSVCTVHALGETPEGQHYIAMEYVEGETLRKRLTSSRVPIRAALDIAVQVASALSAAHAAGIIHRDIKPENVMLRPDGLVKVLDFGLAKLTPFTQAAAADATDTAFRTDAPTIVGTVAYMSPEQARGHQVDARTDIWSMGVLRVRQGAADIVTQLGRHKVPAALVVCVRPQTSLGQTYIWLHRRVERLAGCLGTSGTRSTCSTASAGTRTASVCHSPAAS